MEFAEVLNKIKQILNKTATEKDIIDGLQVIRREINVEFFKVKAQNTNINFLFTNIWQALFYCFSMKNPKIKSLVSKTTFIFLLKNLPFYMKQLSETFCEFTYNENSARDSSHSILIISVFMHLSHYMAPQLLFNFSNMIPLVDHFNNTDTLLSEHLSHIIKNLGPLPDEWFEQLLSSYLTLITAKENQNISSAIATIILRNPTKFLPKVFQMIFERSDLQYHLPLISYIINTVGNSINNIDLYPVAAACFEVFRNDNKNKSTIDSAFQILSLITQSFSLDISLEDKETLLFTLRKPNEQNDDESDDEDVDNQEKLVDKSEILELKFAQYLDNTAFYSLPLPIDFLVPQDTDSAVIIAAKLKSLAKLASSVEKLPDISLVLSIFKKFIDSDNNYLVTEATNSLRFFVNRILYDLPFLSKVLLVEEKSWLHGVDMLSVITKIDLTQLPISMIKMLSYKVIDFCYSKSEKLSKKAIFKLPEFTCDLNGDFLLERASNNFDIFDEFKVVQGCETIYQLVKASPKLGEKSAAIATILLEAIDYYLESATILSSIFKCLSLFSTTNKLSSFIAISLVKGYDELITNHLYDMQAPINIVKQMKRTAQFALEQQIDSDISTGKTIDQVLQPAKSALLFLFNNTINVLGNDLLSDIALKFFPLFPKEVSRFLALKWSELKEDVCSQILASAHQTLLYSASKTLHESFCIIMLKAGGAFNDSQFKLTAATEAETSRFLLSSNIPISPRKAYHFSTFLLSFFYDSLKNVVDYIRRIDIVKQVNFISSVNSCFSDFVELIEPYAPEAVEYFKSLPSFKKIPEQQTALYLAPIEVHDKETCIQEYIRSAYECNPTRIKKALKHFDEFNVPFEEILIPSKSIKTVSQWLSRHQNDRLTNALEKVRSEYKQAALSNLKKTGNSEIERLLNSLKITKNVVCSLCAATQTVQFDPTKLFALTIRLCFEATTVKRRRLVYRFLATCINNSRVMPYEIPDQFMDCVELNPLQAPEEEAEVILSISRKVRPSARVVQYAFRLANLPETSDKITIMLISLQNCQKPEYLNVIFQRISKTLASEVPSIQIGAIRVATQSIVALASQHISPEVNSQIVNAALTTCTSLLSTRLLSPIFIQEIITFIVNVLSRPCTNDQKQQCRSFIMHPIDPRKATSSSTVFLLSAGLRAYPKNSQEWNFINKQLFNLFTYPGLLSSALSALSERIKGEDPAVVQTLINNCLRANISQEFFRTIPRAIELWAYFLLQSFPPVYASTVIAQNFVSCVPFYQIVHVLHLIYKKSNYDTGVAATIAMAQTHVSKDYAEALSLIIQRGDLKRCLELALRVENSSEKQNEETNQQKEEEDKNSKFNDEQIHQEQIETNDETKFVDNIPEQNEEKEQVQQEEEKDENQNHSESDNLNNKEENQQNEDEIKFVDEQIEDADSIPQNDDSNETNHTTNNIENNEEFIDNQNEETNQNNEESVLNDNIKENSENINTDDQIPNQEFVENETPKPLEEN